MLAYLPTPLKWGLMLQCALIVAGSALLLLLNASVAKSYLVGGLVYFIPSTYFALYAFRFRGSAYMELVVNSIYRGQSGKLILVSVGFALAFSFVKPLSNIAFFSAFFLMMASQIVIGRQVSAFVHRQCDQTDRAHGIAQDKKK